MSRRYPLLLIALCCWLSPWLQAQQVLEDFEGGTADLNWEAVQGSFEIVANPGGNRLNMSDFAGAYTKDSTAGFSLFRAILTEPLDLSVNNQLYVDVYASDDTRFIAKLEGRPGLGQAIEGQSVIPVRNQWRRYRFDFSGAGNLDSLTRILFFFDFGNASGKGTYTFDNVVLGTSSCAGVTRDMSIVDDFDCQRTPIRAGFDSLFVVENPDPDGVNGAGPVGEFRDPPGGFAALVYRFANPIDLAANPVVKLKYWSPIANRLLVKLEGGSSPGREIGVDITATNEWQDIEIDFSPFIGDNHRSLTLFTNAGVNAPGVIYYFDDIRFVERQADILEDFDGATPNLLWGVRNNNTAINGTFRVIANPDASGLNTTSNVGEHVKGSSALSTVVALSADPIDLSENQQLNMLVWAPAGSQEVRASLISPTAGRVDITRDIPTTQEWVEMGFNFEDLAGATDVVTLELVFDPGITGARTYYFDQLAIGSATIDPCEGVAPTPRLVDDFECQRNADIVVGAEQIRVVDNPDTDGNTSEKVGEYTDPDDQFSALVYEFAEPLDMSVFNVISVDIWSPKAVPLGFKLEGSTTGAAPIEKVVNVTNTSSWENYRVAFPEAEGGNFRRLTIFFNFAVAPGVATDVYYIDNVRFRRGPVTGCVFDFETENSRPETVFTFAGGPVNDTAYSVVTNPDQSGINPSATVGRFLEGPGGEPFAGMAIRLGAAAIFPDNANQVIRAKFWAPRNMRMVAKLESPGGMPGPQTGDVFSTEDYDTPGQWKEMVWDMSSFDWASAQWETLTFIPGIESVPTELTNIFFDDVVFGAGSCSVSSRDVRAIGDLRAYPNPASSVLLVEMPMDAASLSIVDALGRVVLQQQVIPGSGVEQLQVANLQNGMYTLMARGSDGSYLARTRLSIAR